MKNLIVLIIFVLLSVSCTGQHISSEEKIAQMKATQMSDTTRVTNAEIYEAYRHIIEAGMECGYGMVVTPIEPLAEFRAREDKEIGWDVYIRQAMWVLAKIDDKLERIWMTGTKGELYESLYFDEKNNDRPLGFRYFCAGIRLAVSINGVDIDKDLKKLSAEEILCIGGRLRGVYVNTVEPLFYAEQKK